MPPRFEGIYQPVYPLEIGFLHAGTVISLEFRCARKADGISSSIVNATLRVAGIFIVSPRKSLTDN